ncbi:peptide chain release factor H [Simiduia curdlanivorans]|uniref:Peptide chain release factor H n=1 Tax=Simiduia curdlanivorans TaxID=1492769 RepID=A0ABV8V878_9GAMM|nr:peptide chain release factor H [Simiduia curdlanivorans]MDN3638759.1 peptide chain release factor H [Simiduia curdlanivorans]
MNSFATQTIAQAAAQTIYLQISAGQGPRECGWVVAKVTEKILAAASQIKLCATLLEARAFDKASMKRNVLEPETASYKSALISLAGDGAQALFEQWQGSVQWQGESPYRPGHKRTNWFVSVQCVDYSCLSPASISALEKDVRFEATRSSGPGGQHVNKTSSAVWATHLPTGIKLRVESDRSQHRNRRIALERLQLQLNATEQAAVQQQVAANRLAHYQLQRGNAVKVFCGADFVEKH